MAITTLLPLARPIVRQIPVSLELRLILWITSTVLVHPALSLLQDLLHFSRAWAYLTSTSTMMVRTTAAAMSFLRKSLAVAVLVVR